MNIIETFCVTGVKLYQNVCNLYNVHIKSDEVNFLDVLFCIF